MKREFKISFKAAPSAVPIEGEIDLDLSDLGEAFVYENTIFVASNGNDANAGTSPGAPKATLLGAVTIALENNTIVVLDGNTYTVNTLEIPQGVKVDARNATIIGSIELNTGSVFECKRHYPLNNNDDMLKNKGTGLSYYRAVLSDGRGIDGTITGVTNIKNQTPSAVLFTDVELMFTNKFGIIDTTVAAGGHIHFNLKDLYMVADNAIALEADKNGSNLIGFIDHVLNLGGRTGVKAIHVANGARCTLTVGEIRIGAANTGYEILGSGLLNLNTLENDGLRVGTANDLLARLEALELP